jgi:glycosyltransferase involved in cell wall biosynthesis
MRGAPGGAGVVGALSRRSGAGDVDGDRWSLGAVEPGRRLRVLHVAEAFGGGLLEMVRFLCAGTADEGHDVAIAYGRREETPADVRALLDPRIELHELPWQRSRPGSHVAVAGALRRLAGEWAPDVVHLHSSFAGVIGAFALQGRVPSVFTPHAFASSVQARPGIGRTTFRAVERAVLRRATLVGAVSASEAAQARRLGARDVVVVPNGIPELDSPRIELGGTPAKAGPPLVVGAGRLIGQRRPHACARILRAVAGDGEVAWLGGGGDGGAWSERAREELERAGVPVTGWLAREELLGRLARATAYLHWTTWDGMALTILEAMALDVVVVASRTEPNCELLPDGHVCDSEEEAIALLRSVVADPGLAESMREAQRERRGAYSAQRMTAAWLRHYQQLLPAPQTADPAVGAAALQPA